jgi:hypothetical protein
MKTITQILAAVGNAAAIALTIAVIREIRKTRATAAAKPAGAQTPPMLYCVINLGDGNYVGECRIDEANCTHASRGHWADVADNMIAHALTHHGLDIAERLALTEAAMFYSRGAA